MSNAICKKIIVKGEVQGVFYREAMERRASGLNLKGYVKNMEDGSVEIVAYGDEENIDEMIRFTHKGSLQCRVDSVEVSEYPTENFESFKIS